MLIEWDDCVGGFGSGRSRMPSHHYFLLTWDASGIAFLLAEQVLRSYLTLLARNVGWMKRIRNKVKTTLPVQ